MRNLCLCALLGLACLAVPANATIHSFVVQLSGANEIPPADPDGFGTAHLLIDDAPSPPTITWFITAFNIDPISADHIHRMTNPPPPRGNGPVTVDFSASLIGGPIADADLVNVLADPTRHYVNLHNAAFPGGAIRGDLPEPATFGALALGALALLRRR